MIKIRFFGAARQVTGSCFLVTIGQERVLVDCGLFQGGKETFMLNYDQFGFDPCKINHLILTHAHADHCARIPLLYKRGFRGDVYAHPATCALGEIIMMDSAHIQEIEAGWRSRKNARRGDKQVEPLYIKQDAENALKLLRPVRYNTTTKISDRISFTFHDAGHILGSSLVELHLTRANGEVATLVFTGDLGRKGKPLIKDPDVITNADYLVIESTYGDRKHKGMEKTKEELANIIEEAGRTKGNVIIPAFAVGRTQEIIYYIRELYEEGRIPKPYAKIYVDSPMATRATKVYENALYECYNSDTLHIINHDHSPMRFEALRFVSSVDESMMINMVHEGEIIISASGMCDAGRVLHHLKHNLWNENSHIVIVGYQAEGSKGRKLVDGQPVIKIMREEIVVNAKIHTINALSAHADCEGLTQWAKNISPAPKLTMIVHGEEVQSEGLKLKLTKELGFKCAIPEFGEEIALM